MTDKEIIQNHFPEVEENTLMWINISEALMSARRDQLEQDRLMVQKLFKEFRGGTIKK
jgi:hypothetical protein